MNIKKITTHAQQGLTELRIAINQFANTDDEGDMVAHWHNIAAIMQTVQFDLNDLREDKIKQFNEEVA